MPDAAPVAPAPSTPPAAEAPAAPVEAAVAAPVAAPTEDAKRLAAQAIRNRRERSEREGLAKERAALAAEVSAVKKFTAQLSAAKADPATLLKTAFGEKWREHLTGFMLNGAQITPELVQAQLDERVSGLEAKLRGEQEAARKAEDARLLASWQSDVVDFVTTHSDDYELTNLYDAHGHVQAMIQSEHSRTGKIMSTKDAADKVEAILVGQALKAKKLKAKFSPPPPAPAAKPAAPNRATITNAMTGAAVEPSAPRSPDDAYKRALAILQASASKGA